MENPETVWIKLNFKEELPHNRARLHSALENQMDSSNICRRLATGKTTYIIQINQYRINPVKVASDVPILEDKNEAQRRQVSGP